MRVATNLPYSPITSVSSSKPLAAGGRYYVQEYVPDRSIKIRKNKFYKAQGAPPTPGKVDGFDYDIGIQQDQALLLVKSGQLDWAADGLPPSAWGPLFAQYGTKGRARVFSTSVSDYVTMNNTKGPFKSTNVRKAVAWGIGRNALVNDQGPEGRSRAVLAADPGDPRLQEVHRVSANNPNMSQGSAACSGPHR